MKLKALEICGFKSFAEKTRLSFDKPVTCIVGPNGSGKSNISDAILWVTGEQSTKALRGGKMEDVIFGGTEKRHQMGYAEVSLILDNEDGTLPFDNTEVSITRRFYRSGESEYYINRAQCRLKDVTGLLMDTGMGREGYSIIGQGRIDEILSAKSTDRRGIFEEAAGISRFRHRKEESERKLARTEENLEHVNAKIDELELMVGPLKEQSEKAKKYLSLRDRLRSLEIALWAENLEKLAEERIRLEIKKKDNSLSIVRAKEELDRFYAETETFSDKMREKDVQADALRDLMGDADARIAEEESAAAVLQANLDSVAEERARLESEIGEQENREEALNGQIARYQQRMAEIRQETDRQESAANELQSQMGALLKSDEESSLRAEELLGRERELTERRNSNSFEISALASAAQEMEDRESSAARESLNASEKLKQLQTDAEDNERLLQEKQKEADSLDNIIRGYRMKADSRRKKAEELESKSSRLESDCRDMENRIAFLEELEKDYAGYTKAVKTVMQEASRGLVRGVYGTVGSLVETDDEYALAVETALGGSMQDVLVENEESGKSCIQLLKRKDAGRATFLPVKTMHGSVLNTSELEKWDGFVGTAISLVRFEEAYSGVYRYLLGRVAVVETLDDAIQISRGIRDKIKIVTLDGQVMNASGSMTGGSNAKNAGLLSRANELKVLHQRREDLEKDRKEAKERLNAAKAELEDAEHQFAIQKERRQQLGEGLLRLKADAEHYELLLSAARESLQNLKKDRDALNARLKANTESLEQLRKDNSETEQKLADVKEKIAAMAEGREDVQRRLAGFRAELQKIRENQAALDAELQSGKKASEELERLKAGMADGKERQSSFVRSLENRTEEIKRSQEEKRHAILVLQNKKQELKAQIDAVTAEKLELEGERTRHNRKLQDRNEELLNLERESSRLDQRLTSAEMEEKQLVDKLWESYEITRSEAIQQAVPPENTAEAKKQVNSLKREMSALGTPNIGAIEEYDRVNGRYTFFTEQRADIIRATEELKSIIGDITEEMKTIFSREFEAINVQFRETFLEMFGGGRANLELEDESDILNCGIEIKVQPPGKALKTITLLSGGEKAFVAIALYFAVLKVRPAPFVVMDEIEAALDEANVQRFADYMRRMAEKSQMIVISHRRGTMEEADVLYGVTMQEQGVSRVLNVDLEEAEKSLITE